MFAFAERDTKVWFDGVDITGVLSSVEIFVDMEPRKEAGSRTPGPGITTVKHKCYSSVEDFKRIRELLQKPFGKDYSFLRRVKGGVLEYTLKVRHAIVEDGEEVSKIKPFLINVESLDKPERRRVHTFS